MSFLLCEGYICLVAESYLLCKGYLIGNNASMHVEIATRILGIPSIRYPLQSR